jgi:sugar transferase (PEP-CTERM/EpsH1 system associated)
VKSSEQHRKQLLMLVSRFPYPLDKGDKLRAFHQLKELQKHYDVTLFSLSDHPVGQKDQKIIEQYCTKLVIHQQSGIQKGWNAFRSFFNKLPFQVGYFYSPKAAKKIKLLLKEGSFNHIYCQLIRMSEYVKDEHSISKTLDYMDTLSAGIQRRIDQQPFYKKWLFRSEAKRLRSYESRMFDFFEHKTIISEQDRQLIMHPESSKIKCVPNGIDSTFFDELNVDKTHDFVFVGNMSYPPNIDAVQYIAKYLLPEFPESTLLVSGSSPHAKIKKLAEGSTQIMITGWVDDIRFSYLRGNIFVAPMMIGTGMQNKLLEAMALGIPCITTPLANSPIRTTHEKEILVASDPVEFVAAIKRLKADQELYSTIQAGARKFVQNNYSWEHTTKELRSLIEEIP